MPSPCVCQLSLSLPINESTDELTKERIEDILGLVVAFPVALRYVHSTETPARELTR